MKKKLLLILGSSMALGGCMAGPNAGGMGAGSVAGAIGAIANRGNTERQLEQAQLEAEAIAQQAAGDENDVTVPATVGDDPQARAAHEAIAAGIGAMDGSAAARSGAAIGQRGPSAAMAGNLGAAASGAGIGLASGAMGAGMGAAFNAMAGESSITYEDVQAMNIDIQRSDEYVHANGLTCVDFTVDASNLPEDQADQFQKTTACQTASGEWEPI
ncbi:hypothetical protein [Thioalkalivibrio sp. AKL8]|uniref:hypothetical protein n=1 Tax=Thioalkalivibrio sp. AKL8 TaxID=1158156 RepID=UPI0005B88A1C|nr:hypothetical protein [Thioalkalivibrio sp. AKL8]